MSLFSRIATRAPKEDQLPFLHEVDFEVYKADLASLACQMEDAARETTRDLRVASGTGPLFRIVEASGELDALCMILESASVRNAWIEGPRGIGKTTLIEELMRRRAERRLAPELASKPVFFFDVSAFYKLPRTAWSEAFNATMQTVVEHKGLLVIDHFDDFVRMGDGEAGRLVNTLVSALENDEETQAIILSESKHRDEILEASSGVDRRFERRCLEKEMDSASLKNVLIAQFRTFEKLHQVDFTEDCADEIIRLLERYPGRAFPFVRPRNAIAFADRVATFVKNSKYAEPLAVGEMREKLGILRDRLAVLSPLNDEEGAQAKSLKEEIAALESAYAEADGKWRERFAPLFKKQDDVAKLEARLAPLQEKAERSAAEEEKRAALLAALQAERERLREVERALYTRPPRVSIEAVRHVFSLASGVPLDTLSADKTERLRALPAALDAEIFLQDQAKQALARAYRARELGICDPRIPAGVYIFLGDTGVGKTELVRCLARFDGGPAAEPVIINLSEFADKSSAKRLTGADPGLVGYDDGAPVFDGVIKNGRAIVLFDEADKANPAVYTVLTQMLDTGSLRTSQGTVIDFKDTIIVFAMNGLTPDDFSDDEKGNEALLRKRLLQVVSDDTHTPLFKKEFLARVNEVLLFDRLGAPEHLKIFRKEIASLNRAYRLRGLSIDVSDDEARKILDAFFDPQMGSRSFRAIGKNKIGPLVSSYLLSEGPHPEGTLCLSLADEGRLRLGLPDGSFFDPDAPRLTGERTQPKAEPALVCG